MSQSTCSQSNKPSSLWCCMCATVTRYSLDFREIIQSVMSCDPVIISCRMNPIFLFLFQHLPATWGFLSPWLIRFPLDFISIDSLTLSLHFTLIRLHNRPRNDYMGHSLGGTTCRHICLTGRCIDPWPLVDLDFQKRTDE